MKGYQEVGTRMKWHDMEPQRLSNAYNLLIVFPSFSCTVHFAKGVEIRGAWITQSKYNQSVNNPLQLQAANERRIESNWTSGQTEEKNSCQRTTWRIYTGFSSGIHNLPICVIGYWVLVICNDPSFCSFRLRLVNRSLEYCLEAFLQSVPAFIIAANSS